MSEGEEKFIEFCKDVLGVFDTEVNMQTRPVEDLDISSFESVNLFSSLEDKYGVEMNMSEVVLVDTFQDLYDLIKSKQEV